MHCAHPRSIGCVLALCAWICAGQSFAQTESTAPTTRQEDVRNRSSADASDQVVKVFILAGQSNMEGYGALRTLDQLGKHPTHGPLLKKIRNSDGSMVVRDDVFVSYKRDGKANQRKLSMGFGAPGEGWFGPELLFGIQMGDHLKEPVLLIKTCWGGHSLYGNFRPPSAGPAAYETGHKPEDIGASYHKMVAEVRECLAGLDAAFPELSGHKPELCGLVWVQGWNDLCADDKIKRQVFAEYSSNFVHLVQDLRAEFKVPALPVVVAEMGVSGEKPDQNMIDFREAQAKLTARRELKGSLGYVRTAPFWYAELDELPAKRDREERRVRTEVEAQFKKRRKDQPANVDPKKMEELLQEAVAKALEKDQAFHQARKECDRHVAHWECHYQGSARVYALMGYSLAEAMKPLLATKR